MNPDLDKLQPYPFEKLTKLKADCSNTSSLSPIALSIGEPKHPAPEFVLEAINTNISTIASYPLTKGTDALRESISSWLSTRFTLPSSAIDPQKHVLPVNGTREALFAFAQAVIDRTSKPLVLMPNPFYQIYEGAALLAGAEPYFLNCDADNGYIPDFENIPESVWQRCQLLYLCSPGNPTGAVIAEKTLQDLIERADRYDFIIASDECYSEIYPDENNPPVGLLTAAANMGRDDFRRCVVFHSLSKRSNLPGLRSGFVAGDEFVIQQFLRYRTYHGCAMAPPVQIASCAAWGDEKHVKINRELYREKFRNVLDILSSVLDVKAPDAAFYLWPKTPIDDAQFAQQLFAQQNVAVLPGSFLSRADSQGINPGSGHVRMALVAPIEECLDAANRIKHFINTL